MAAPRDNVPDRGRTRGLFVVAAVALIAVLAVGGGYWFLNKESAPYVPPPGGVTLVEFSGDADMTTDPFTVRPGWAIHWESTGDAFAFAIRGDRDLGTVIDLKEAGSGVTSPTVAGTFHLEVSAAGPWSIRIEQGQ